MKITPQLLSFGILSLGLLLGATALASAKPAYVASTVNLRAAPGTTSEVVTKIPGGSLVDADNCSEGWCAVTWQDKSGFAIQSALDMSGRVPVQRAARPPTIGGGSILTNRTMSKIRRRSITSRDPIITAITVRITGAAGGAGSA
jgi:uncharacterized protein YraI